MTLARCLLLTACLITCTPGLAQSDTSQSDTAEGEQLYTSHCRMCHGFNDGQPAALAPRSPQRLVFAHAAASRDDAQRLAFAPPFGPNLHGIVGREAGTVPGFQYSRAFLDALKGMVWTEGTLDWWIRDTQAWVPGVMMYYKQADPEVRRKIIAFLKANS